jgi:hypothetical protein
MIASGTVMSKGPFSRMKGPVGGFRAASDGR